MAFALPGAWQITLDVYEGDKRRRLTEKVKIELSISHVPCDAAFGRFWRQAAL